MERILCDQLDLYRNWACVFARFGFRLDLVPSLEEHHITNDNWGEYGDYAGTLTYRRHDLQDGESRGIDLEIGDRGLSLTGEADKRHLDLTNLEGFLLRRTGPWSEPTDPLHEAVRAARLVSACADSYTVVDRAAALYVWASRIRNLAPPLFDDQSKADRLTSTLEEATDLLGDRYLSLTAAQYLTPTLLTGSELDFADFIDAATWEPELDDEDINGSNEPGTSLSESMIRCRQARPAWDTPAERNNHRLISRSID